MKRSTFFSLLTILVLIPLTLFLGTKLHGRWYYVTSTMIVGEVMLPFFFAFENRRPQPRELVIIAVMAALAAASRVVFGFIPIFKPITAIIMITGIAFGAQAGFLTGAVAAFASNFFFSQGPWTPWQMMAYGFAGFMAGLIFHNRRSLCRRWPLTVYSFFAVLLVIGPLLDCCTVFTTLTVFTWESVLVVFARGVFYNARHGFGCALAMLLFSQPLLYKLDRLRIKYGLLDRMEAES